MVSAREILSASYPASPDTVATARDAVVEFASTRGASGQELHAIRLAVSEAVTNAVIHAYRGSAGEIEVTAGFAGGELWVLVSDDGCGFQMPSPTPGQGWGMPLIAHASDELTIAERAAGGTEVRMRFEIGGDR